MSGLVYRKIGIQSIRHNICRGYFQRIGAVHIVSLNCEADEISVCPCAECVEGQVIINRTLIERIAVAVGIVRRAEHYPAG